MVNFHRDLRVLIAEAHYLDRKGFNIPPLALQVALQQSEYRAWTESLERLLDLYYEVRTWAPGMLPHFRCFMFIPGLLQSPPGHHRVLCLP